MNSYIKVAICDDDINMVNIIENKVTQSIESYGYKVETEVFLSGEKLLKSIIEDKEFYELYILDIDMNGINGIEAAEKVKRIQEEAIIIFLTSYDRWMSDAFDVQAFNYILKEDMDRKLSNVIYKSIEFSKRKKSLYKFKQGKNNIILPYKDIVYFESEKRKVNVITNNEEYCYYDTLNDVQSQVRDDIFIRVHTSFIVNMEYIMSFDGKNIFLRNGGIIPVSQKYIFDFNMGYMKFLKKRC
ncbi:MAG: LytTR family DNA-binding domain-containing protein [Clostridium sp.]|nr:LytTR family DNA-binding domain-containing protein [Clostridium sp.]